MLAALAGGRRVAGHAFRFLQKGKAKYGLLCVSQCVFLLFTDNWCDIDMCRGNIFSTRCTDLCRIYWTAVRHLHNNNNNNNKINKINNKINNNNKNSGGTRVLQR